MTRAFLALALAAAIPAAAQAHDVRGIRTTWDPPQGVLIGTTPGGGFSVYVASNLSTDASARRVAVVTAGKYCIRDFDTNRIRFNRIRRHSNLDLAAWVFQGQCR